MVLGIRRSSFVWPHTGAPDDYTVALVGSLSGNQGTLRESDDGVRGASLSVFLIEKIRITVQLWLLEEDFSLDSLY